MRSAALLLVVTFLSASFLTAQNSPVPLINQLTPPTARPRKASFTFTVTGFGFTPNSTIYWNGSPRTTLFLSNMQLQTTLSATDVFSISTGTVTVVTPPPGGGTSNPAYLPIRFPAASVGFARKDIHSDTANGFALADFDKDGKLDMAVGEYDHVQILLGNGDESFRKSSLIPTRINVALFAEGDLNGDGKMDLLVGDNDFGTDVTLLGDGHGYFSALPHSIVYNAWGISGFLILADFNGDGRLDLLQGCENCLGVFVDLGMGNGKFIPTHQLYLTNVLYEIGAPAVGDFNGDGILDLGVPAKTEVDVFLGNGDATFQSPVSYPVDVPWTGNDEGAKAVDLNSDGKLDIVTNAASVLLGNGDGTFRSGGGIYAGLIQSTDFGYADFNGDLFPDLAIGANDSSSSTSNQLRLFLGNDDGSFQTPFIFNALYTPGYGDYSLGIGDLDNDGKLDVAMRDYQPFPDFHGNISVFLQSSTPISPSSLAFPDQLRGTTSDPQTVTLSNFGKDSIYVRDIRFAGHNPREFGQSGNCGGTLDGDASCSIHVTFSPRRVGDQTAYLNVVLDQQSNPLTVFLGGTGVTGLTPASH